MRDALEQLLASLGGVTSDQVGEVMRTLFADARARRQAEIKAQVAVLSLGRHGARARLGAAGVALTEIKEGAPALVELGDRPSETGPEGSVLRAVPGAVPRGRRGLLVGAVFFFVLLALGLAVTVVVPRAPLPVSSAAAEAAPDAAERALTAPDAPRSAAVPTSVVLIQTPATVLAGHPRLPPARPHVVAPPRPVVPSAAPPAASPSARPPDPPSTGRLFRHDL
jgi:hypothetical protein